MVAHMDHKIKDFKIVFTKIKMYFKKKVFEKSIWKYKFKKTKIFKKSLQQSIRLDKTFRMSGRCAVKPLWFRRYRNAQNCAHIASLNSLGPKRPRFFSRFFVSLFVSFFFQLLFLKQFFHGPFGPRNLIYFFLIRKIWWYTSLSVIRCFYLWFRCFHR